MGINQSNQNNISSSSVEDFVSKIKFVISFNTNPDHLRYLKFYQALISNRDDLSLRSVLITTVGIREFFAGIFFLLRGYRVFHVIHDFVPHPGAKYFITVVYNRVACIFFGLVFHSRSQAEAYGGKCYVFPLPITKLVRTQPIVKGAFFSFGRFEIYKNYDYIILLARYFPDYNFIIASRNLILPTIPKNVTVYTHFLSEDELGEMIKASRAVLLPYTSATQSGVIISAFEFSKPVIVSNIDGLTEYLSDSGALGHSFELTDPRSFQNAAIKVAKIAVDASYNELENWNSSRIL